MPQVVAGQVVQPPDLHGKPSPSLRLPVGGNSSFSNSSVLRIGVDAVKLSVQLHGGNATRSDTTERRGHLFPPFREGVDQPAHDCYGLLAGMLLEVVFAV